ncbi:hypothetical protein X762_08805 [Mesorhizobium sp. LSHC426A00]|nr:hypothetical protein X762_08805 [Mesorhizobium sp. LSHC426A00]ESX57858.1 hypothetical protein X761_07720 [Mesorhizobium sp. LSHC424B00]ESX75405.1 hypothetical protein X758_04240 [Mesorhizobium sp. LSHC416B00]ESY20213.1 hypothetical protein X751_11695 [Mesorhizobium sp. LNJC395A00]
MPLRWSRPAGGRPLLGALHMMLPVAMPLKCRDPHHIAKDFQ